MSEVKIGQVWKTRDKRRNTIIEILAVSSTHATGLVVGTETERDYSLAQLTSRWDLIESKALTAHHSKQIFEWDGKGSMHTLAEHSHIHTHGECVKNRDEEPCDVPKAQVAVGTSKYKTREQWLQAGVVELTKLFEKADFEVPEVRVSVGWPGGRGKKTGVVGQCFPSIMADDEELQKIVDKLGPFPHAAIREGERPAVQKTYMAKVIPSEECRSCDPEYKLRMTQKWIEEAGLPLCPHGVEMVEG